MIKTGHDIQPSPSRRLRLATGRWRVDPAQSHASFAARVGGQVVGTHAPDWQGDHRGTGREFDSVPCCQDACGQYRVTGAGPTAGRTTLPGCDGLPGDQLPVRALAWVPDGWRAVGSLRVKNAEHELACQFGLHRGDTRPHDMLPEDVRHIVIASNWVIDSRWVTSHWIPTLSRNVVMTCSFSLVPEI